MSLAVVINWKFTSEGVEALAYLFTYHCCSGFFQKCLFVICVYLLPSILIAIAGIVGSYLFELHLSESSLIQPSHPPVNDIYRYFTVH